jgi:hypothetical protein
LRDDHPWPLTWEFDGLDWTGNPATVGLFRLAGIARTSGGEEVPWIVVLKVVADVDLTGDPLIDRYTHEPEGINYWNREALAFSSGLLIGWPGPLVPAHWFGFLQLITFLTMMAAGMAPRSSHSSTRAHGVV